MKMKNIDPKGYKENYIRCVLRDPEFLDKIKNLNTLVAEYEQHNPGNIFVGTKMTAPPNIRAYIEKIVDDFEIDWDYIILTREGYSEQIASNRTIGVGINKVGRIEIDMDPEITKEEFINFWPMVESQRTKLVNVDERKRGAASPEVFYAIYRERKKNNTSYMRISAMISEGSLLGYKKGAKYSQDRVKDIYHTLRGELSN
jgi:hypothetical protein